MPMRSHKQFTAVILALLCLLPPALARAASLGQLDDFDDIALPLQNWQMGVASVTEARMANIADGGPAGAGDAYLEVTAATDGSLPFGGNRLTFFNRVQWTGDFSAAGITAIAMDLKNFSTTEILNMRLAINGGFGPSSSVTGGVFTSSTSVSLGIGGGWTRAVFSLSPGDLIAISGGVGGNTAGNDVAATLANVEELRLLNSVADSWSGQPVTATLGVDNIAAVPLPPALALFGSALMALVLVRRKKPTGIIAN